MPVPFYKHTFEELRNWALKITGKPLHFDFITLGREYAKFWNDINQIESERGLDIEEYVKPGTPALCEMMLLKDKEFEEWKGRFRAFHRKKQREDMKKAVLEFLDSDHQVSFKCLLKEVSFVAWPKSEGESFQKEKLLAEILNELIREGKVKSQVMLATHAESYMLFYNSKRWRPYP